MQLSLSKENRSGYTWLKQMAAFCFIVAAALIGTNATMRAADKTPATASAAPAPRLKSTVRVDARTGRLVRVMVPVAAARPVVVRRPAAPDPAIQALVAKTANDYNVSPALVNSVIDVESGFNPLAVSWKGAQGIMQLMPATARRFGVSDAFDVKQNVEGGVRYLRFLRDTFKDDQLAIAAYNAGEGAVTKYNGIPPYPETVSYVKKVGQRYEAAKKTAADTQKTEVEAKAQLAVAEPPPEEKQPPLVMFYDEHGRLHMVTQ
jgi:soluble lytic murein transglycosylase-like protein